MLMSNFIAQTLDAIKEFLNGINNTIWGLLIIFVCIVLKVKGTASETVYYFAGIGSTLLGIKHETPAKNITTVVNSDIK